MAEERQVPEEKEKCFVIMPISDQGDYPEGHFSKVYDQIFKPAIEDAGYEAYRVDENKICDSIMRKIFNAIYECPMAICDLSNRNPNVLYELGLRQAYDKPVVLLQDEKTDKIFDISGINTVYYKSDRLYENVFDARKRLTEAIISTREGKQDSIIKIWRATAADVSHISMTKEDKLEILIRGVLNDIQEIKTKIDNGIQNEIELNYEERNLRKNANDHKVVLQVDLKEGVTKKEINSVVSTIEKITGRHFFWKAESGKAYVAINVKDLKNAEKCMIELMRLGEVSVERP